MQKPADMFVAVLREAREKTGLSAEQLGTELGLHHHIINDWETGKRTPRLGSAIRWAQALGYRLELR